LFYAYSNTKTTFSITEYDTVKSIDQTATSVSRVQTVDKNTAYIKPGNYISYRVMAVDSQGVPSEYSDPDGIGIPQIRWQQTTIDSGKSTSLLKSNFLSDLDHNPNELTLEITQPENITVTQITNGIQLEPSPLTFTGQARFRLSATDPDGFHDDKLITINVVNTGEPNNNPIAEDDIDQTGQNKAKSINVLLNDTDPDGDPIFVSQVSPALHGSVVNNQDSTITYTPQMDYSGSDSFTYQISDGRGGTDQGTVKITIISDEVHEQKVRTYPNPFKGRGENKIVFDPVPEEATEIFIITLNNQLVYNENIKQFAGRRWEWPVVTNGNQHVASGVYLYVIKGKGDRNLASGKIAIIR
jgi:hypothetical protein